MGSLKTIDKVMKASPAIRIATLCNSNGKIIYSARRKSVKNRLTHAESRRALAAAAKAWKIRKSVSRKIGKGRYVIAEYDKVKRITMPMGKNLLYVTTSPGANHNKIISRLRRFRG